MTERREPQAHPIRDLLSFFDGCYTRHAGMRYPVNGGKDAKLLKDLRELYTDDQIRSFMAAFFEIDDPFIEQSGHSMGVFRGCLPKLIQFVQRGHVKDVPKNLTGIADWAKRRAANE